MAPLKSRTNGHQVTIDLALAKFALGIKKTNLYHVVMPLWMYRISTVDVTHRCH